MKKIEVTPKQGIVARYPIFTTVDPLKKYMLGQSSAVELVSQIVSVELDGKELRRAVVEFRGFEGSPGNSPQGWPRLIRGAIEQVRSGASMWVPFSGWCHPGMLPFRDFEDERAVIRRCDDEQIVDLDALFSYDETDAASIFRSM